MKSKLKTALAALALGLSPVLARAHKPAAAPAPQALQLQLQPSSKLWLRGESTLHPYQSFAKRISVTAELKPAAKADGLAGLIGAGSPFQFDLTVPVESMKSGEGGLDSNMYKAMAAAKYPDIRYDVKSYRTGPAADGKGLSIVTKGTLSICSVSRDVSITGQVLPGKDGLEITGEYPLLMSDYGVKPPELMFGMIKCSDQVVIHFDLRFKQDQAGTASLPQALASSK